MFLVNDIKMLLNCEYNKKYLLNTNEVENIIYANILESDLLINKDKRLCDEYSKKALGHYIDFKNEKALHYIDLALNLDKSHSNNWDIKAIILEASFAYQCPLID